MSRVGYSKPLWPKITLAVGIVLTIAAIALFVIGVWAPPTYGERLGGTGMILLFPGLMSMLVGALNMSDL